MSDGVFHYEQRRLENEFVALEPFNTDVHGAPFVEGINNNPGLFTYMTFPAIETEAVMREMYDHTLKSPQECLYAIIDKLSPPEEEKPSGKFAGFLSLNETNPINAVTEMGAVIFPAFQGTHVATNAIGLLLIYLLDPPSAGGLGLRRVEWRCHTANEASRRTALRMGFEFEGISRWHRVFPGSRVSLPVEALENRNGTKGEQPGRHTANFSIVWDEWDEKRPNVVAKMERKR